jgi:hypothetical protein
VTAEASTVAIALGNGDGTFQDPLRSTFSASFYGQALLAAGYLDADSNIDLVVVPYTSGTPSPLFVMRGNGDGTFTVSATPSVPVGDHRVAVADLNGDSHPDILVTNTGAGTLSVLLGDSSASFAAGRMDFAVGASPSGLAVGDVNGDSKLDVVVTVPFFVSVLKGSGDGTFQAAYQYPTGYPAGPVATTDLNGDGRQDVVVPSGVFCCGQIPNFSVFLAEPGGVLAERADYFGPSGATAIAVADLDGDGTTDFVVASGDGVEVVRGLVGSQVLAAPVAPIGGFVVADVDENGRSDLISQSGTAVLAYRSTGTGTLQPITLSTFSDSVSVQAAGDFNGDGHVDLIVVQTSYPNSIFLLAGHGDGTFGPPVSWGTSVVPGFGEVGDFNGDGFLDFVITGQYDQQFHVYLGNGDGTFQSPMTLTVSTGIAILRAVDLNGDGKTDILAISYPGFGQGTLFELLGSATGLGSATALSVAGSSFDVFDLDGDLAPDLIVAGGANVALYRGKGDGSFEPPIYIGLAGAPQRAAAGDFDHDGIPDIATIQSGHISLLHGLGGLAFETPTDQFVGGGNPIGLRAVDVSGGGVPDLVLTLVDNGGSNVQTVLFQAAVLAANRPQDQTTCLGSTVTLKTAASGYGPVTYQWRRGGTPLSDGPGITGTTTPVLTIAAGAPGDQGSYDVVVTDLCTTATSDAATVTLSAPLPAPTIGPASVPPGVGTITVSIASPAPAGGALVHVNGPYGSLVLTIAAGTTSAVFGIGTSPGTSFVITADVTINGCTSALGTRTISVDFNDVPAGNPFREFVNTLSRDGVTAGCGNGNFCPDDPVTRAQMAVFLLISDEGPAYVPPPCSAPTFSDVPCSSGFARWIDELAARDVTSGCAPGLYCPGGSVTREQMAVFVLRTHDGPSYVPPPCTGTPIFNDVPCSSPFSPWIQELYNRGVVTGCGSGNFCPTATVSRAQMAVFLVGTFALH